MDAAQAVASGIAAARAKVVLYDLMCPVDGRIKTGLTFEACLVQAREHNRVAGHNADCKRRKSSS